MTRPGTIVEVRPGDPLPCFSGPTFPTSIKVGYRLYKVERWAPIEANARGMFGECCHTTGFIRVSDVLVETDWVKAANTLLHEILHACWYVGDLEDESKQEKTVTVLANQLSAVMRDNPEAFAWIASALA